MPNDKSPPEPETVAQQETGGDCVSRIVVPLWEGKLWHDRGPYSDWGWIRDEAGNLIFIVRSQCGDYSDEAAEHRRNKTDPTQPRVDALLAAINGAEIVKAAMALVKFWEDHGGGNGVMARAKEDALIRACDSRHNAGHPRRRDLWNKCHECGRIIPYADFESGKALNQMISPDSDVSMEEWEILCREHYKPSNASILP
jgi:hypothetical protein